MPENAVPENRCGRLGRNDTRGGHRGGRGRPRTSANETHWPGRTKAARPFLLTKARAAAMRERGQPRERDDDGRGDAARVRAGASCARERARTSRCPTTGRRGRKRPHSARGDARERDATRERDDAPPAPCRSAPRPAPPRTRRRPPANETPRGGGRAARANEICARGRLRARGRQILQDDDAGAPPARRRSYHGRGRRAAQKRGICRNCVGIRRRPRLRARRYILTPTTTPREGNDDGKHQRIQGRAAQVLFPHG